METKRPAGDPMTLEQLEQIKRPSPILVELGDELYWALCQDGRVLAPDGNVFSATNLYENGVKFYSGMDLSECEPFETMGGSQENTELLDRAEAAEKIVEEYAEAARAIALWLSAFCDRSLSYPSMISNAARKISLAYTEMENRAKSAEARYETLERLVKKYRDELIQRHQDQVELAAQIQADAILDAIEARGSEGDNDEQTP